MVRLKVIAIGTSPAETLLMEEALHQTGYLESFRYIGLEQALERVPGWEEWDLIMARYSETASGRLLSLLAPVLRSSIPPVFFFIDPFDPAIVTRLLNIGGRRVLPINQVDTLLQSNLDGTFGDEAAAISLSFSGSDNGKQTHPNETGADQEPFQGPDEGFARLFRSSPVGVSINRLRDGKCLDCNESFARLMDLSREDLLGHEILELAIPPDIKEFFLPERPGAGERNSSSVQFERKIYTRDRQIRQIQVNLDLIEWKGEECTISVVQDITEKEQVKDKIKRLNDELERLVLVRTGALEAANRELAAEISRRKVLEDFSNQLNQIIWETTDVVAIYAPDGKMQFLNKAGRLLLGVSEDGALSHFDLFSAFGKETRDWIHDTLLPYVVRQGIWRGETEYQLPDGHSIPISMVFLCKKDEKGSLQYFASIARDVSEFKYVEQELRHSRERYRTLAEAAHDFIFMVSLNGTMEYANGYACKALRFEPHQVEGMSASRFFHNFSVNHLQIFKEVQEIDRPVYTEGPFRLDGQEFWMGTWFVPVHNENGGMISVLGISRDITEQKKTDEALQRALQNERKLNEMRANFFSMTSHQFRTPLSTILLSAELLQKYGQRWDDQKRSEHLGRIEEAAKRLNSMLEDILMIGRAESGRYVCTPRHFDLIAVCDQLVREMSTNDQSNHSLIFDHEADSLPVFQDIEVFRRVVDNLLSNAIKYSPKSSTVHISARVEDDFALLEVSDEGIGIPERDMQYLFQPFQRGSNAAEFPGTGIGLTIIQKSMELMKGNISLKSKEGQGTTFMVRFPVRFDEQR